MIAGTKEQGEETPEERAFYHKMMEYSRQRLKKMKNKYEGEDCFVIGTAPSLNKTDFSLIRNKYLFGVNQLYKGFKKFNINPQFYGLADGAFLTRYGDEVMTIDAQLFLTRFAEIQYLRKYEYYSKIVKHEPLLLKDLLPEMTESKKFSKDVSEGKYSGWTTIIDTGLQVCYHLGFNRVILLGCDCDYSQEGGHFYDNPLAIDSSGVVPKWFFCYEICKQAYEEDGRGIINATVGGSLEVFPRNKLENLV